MADDIARLSRLKAQLEHPVSGHPYELDRPPIGWPVQQAGSTPDPQRLKAEWTAAKDRAASARSAEEQRSLLWIALHLTDAKSGVGQHIEARAVLETALDLLAVRIAEAAAKLGFPAPAHGSPSLRPVLVSAAFVTITAFIAVCMIAIELAVR